MPATITITGTRSTDHRSADGYEALFADYLTPFAQENAQFYIGGAEGIDSLSLLWLVAKTTSSVTIVVPGTVAAQPSEARAAIAEAQGSASTTQVVELEHPGHPSTEAYYFRNRWMVDRSEFVIAFPHGDDQTRGTWYTANYAAEQGKPRLIVPV